MAELRALHFACHGSRMFGVLHVPEHAATRGVLIVTGGPQYRIGSHRQFVLLARHLAGQQFPVMRFDYRGMGDSEGTARNFESIQDDLEAAICAFFAALPAVKELVLWGLCDGATAAAFHAASDPRIIGLVMLNPWVRTAHGHAGVTLRHYYWRRMRERTFWTKLATGRINLRHALGSMHGLALAATAAPSRPIELPERLFQSLHSFRGQILVILSGADLVAREFMRLSGQHAHWHQLMSAARVRQIVIERANHTFATHAWRTQVADTCLQWLRSW